MDSAEAALPEPMFPISRQGINMHIIELIKCFKRQLDLPFLSAQVVDDLFQLIGSLYHLGIELEGTLRLNYIHHLV